MNNFVKNNKFIICNLIVEKKGLQYKKYHEILNLILLDRPSSKICMDYLNSKIRWYSFQNYGKMYKLECEFVRNAFPNLPKEWEDVSYSFNTFSIEKSHFLDYKIMVFRKDYQLTYKYLIGEEVANDFNVLNKVSFERKYKTDYHFTNYHEYQIEPFDSDKYIVNIEEPWIGLKSKMHNGLINKILSTVF